MNVCVHECVHMGVLECMLVCQGARVCVTVQFVLGLGLCMCVCRRVLYVSVGSSGCAQA